MCPQNARNVISGTQILKPSLANSSLYGTRLTPSAIVYYPAWGGEGKERMGPLAICPTLTEESLKNVLF
jgi:hypothetical protein